MKMTALNVWKHKKQKLPADEQGEANYNGEIMLDSWMQTFRSYSDGAKGSTVDRSLNALKPIMEIIGCLSRNTTPTERTLKAIKMVDNNEGPGMSLEHLNDCLLVKSYIAQDKTLLADGSCTFYAQFVQNWTSRYGRRWCSRKNFRADRGNTQNIRKHRPLSEKETPQHDVEMHCSLVHKVQAGWYERPKGFHRRRPHQVAGEEAWAH